MLTLAFGMLFHSFLFKFYGITGGDQGMRVLRPLLLGMEWRGGKTAFLTGPFYYYALVLFALLGLAMWRITQSPFGLHLRAIRENAGKAAYVGVQIFRMRLTAFVISAVYGGIGGTILAVTTGLADPELAYWTHSGNLVFMAVLGGSGTFAGPAIGALVFVLLQDFVMSVTQYWRFVMGGVLVLLVVFMPQGLSGTVEALAQPAQGRAVRCSPLPYLQPRRCSRPSTSPRHLARSRRSAMSPSASVTASSSRSSGRTAPARPRWSMSSPGCCGRRWARFASWGRISPASGRSNSRGAACRAPFSSSISSRR